MGWTPPDGIDAELGTSEIGHITTAGALTEFPLPSTNADP
jgi:hypothetical protein